jgi:hypothetical protein
MACFPSSTAVTRVKVFVKGSKVQQIAGGDRDRAPPPGIFRLFAIGELVGYKPCAILAASWSLGQW